MNLDEFAGLSKREIRKIILNKRSNMTSEEVKNRSEIICDSLINDSFFMCADKICLYMPIRNEVDTVKLINASLEKEKKVYLPKVIGDEMKFFRYEGNTSLVAGAYNILEPQSDEELMADELTLVVMPGSVFSIKLERIGYGGGYYDRYLSGNPDVKTVALAYDFQVIDKIPTETHDIPPMKIITEERVLPNE